MRPLLNVLYVTTADSYLSRQGETICVHVGGEEKVRIPVHTLESVVCFGHTTVSTPLMGFCSERGIRLSFLSEHGRFYGRLEGSVSGNVFLRRAQYWAASAEGEAAKIAWGVILAKVLNSRNILLRSAREARDEGDGARLRAAAEDLRLIAQQAEPSAGIAALRGLEGAAAHAYFGAFDAMIRANREDFRFLARTRRPPRDRINALLSFLYTMLVHDTGAALETVGFDPQMGFLHSLRPGRPSLALDLAEELRAPVCDRLALLLINLRQLQSDDFDIGPTEVVLKDTSRRRLLTAWQQRKREEVIHPYLNEKVMIGLIPHVQAQLLARYLRGDLDAYPAFHWR